MSEHIFTHVMLDLETMGKGPDAAIAAIGACTFDIAAGKIGTTYYNRVDLASAVSAGGVIDASTVTWWLQQDDEARAEIAREGGMHIAEALQSFEAWMARHTHDAEVWGNGANFDNVILRNAYARNGTPAPWAWWNDRCYRTVKALNRGVPMERLGTHHNALDDAISQALHLIRIFDATAAVEDNFAQTQAEPGVPDDIMRNAMRYRFLRAARTIPISHQAARDPVVYDGAIDAAMFAAVREGRS